ncbi:alpha/beta hydrolase [Streptomyces prasinopilosus]|uniref:alpha/beta hydrolase n=1 Tax=Streptomyces prasinopilosus TaxID=67344 RepID=UPI0006EBDE0F|nr:alpha/beta hydrolase [Streptomyces prasinopilosus]
MDLATLKAIKPAEYSEAADGYRGTSDMAGAAKDRIENQIAVAVRNRLKGEAATAAVRQLGKLGQNFHYIQAQCGLIGTALEAFSYEMEAAKRKLDTALENARAAHLTVNADGSVTYPPGGEKGEDGKVPAGGTVSGLTDGTASALGRQAAGFDPNPHHRLARDCADLIATALGEATEADEKWAPKLRALKADDDLTVSDADWADTSSDAKGVTGAGGQYLASLPQPPEDGSPKENAEWWKELSAEEQAAWASMRPGTVGGLDGLPSTVRDEANRMVFDTTRGRMRTELNSIPAPPSHAWTWISAGGHPSRVHTDEWMQWHNKYGDRYDRLNRSLKGMQAIQDRFDATGTRGLPEAYLLGFNTEKDGRAILANGNPDTAHHTAVYVPGTESDLGGIGGNINRMVNVWRAANGKVSGESVSTITWLGYDAPDHVARDAPFEHYAYDGAPEFRNFMDGLEASHSGNSSGHTAVIAHSYGTTLVGAAAQTGHLNADEVIFAGSPGVKVSSADEMDVPEGHVWNQEADGDIVPDIGRWGHGGDGFIIPSDPEFGANQVTTDTEGHSDYWKPDTESLLNQALIVVGKGDEAVLKSPSES